MAYNNGFPMSYYHPNQPSAYSTFQNVGPAQNGIIWVQGEAGAKSYLVAPNNTVQLWDSESQTIYLKSADASGMPSMKVLDYKIRNQEQSVPHQISGVTGDYVTINDFNALKAEIKRINDELEKLMEANNAKHKHDSEV